ncbi:hypothetical protein SOVF_029520 [Spinacia oleracea]|nr:hypothetical protein SOVF_029520 [Spinacia oleracea]
MKLIPESIHQTWNLRKSISHQRKLEINPPLAAMDSDTSYQIHSLADVVNKFYKCINDNDRKALEDLISSDCRLEDSAFPYIIHKKKEVISLLVQLADSMGENVQFKLGTVCQGEELIASVNWHLEWKEDQIPFSKGCSTFQCSNEGDRLVIRKIQNITESPVKPGVLTMALLKMVRSLFDEFPKPAKWFLKSPHIILQAVLNIYGLFLSPIVNPILTVYITLCKIMARTLGSVMSFLHLISRFFNNNSTSTDIDTKSSSTNIDKTSPPTDTDNDDTSVMETEEEPNTLPEQT